MRESKEIIVEFWGDFACFSPPYAKVERLTYPFPTPSAVRGMLSSIYCKPVEFYWQVKRIEVLRPIRYISFKRNEVKVKVSNKPISTDDERTQRQTVALKDVRYRVYATLVAQDGFTGNVAALYEQARRRISSGKCFLQPSLGLREFAAYFEEFNPEKHTEKPIDENLDAGLMVYDIFDLHNSEKPKKAKTCLSLFHAQMKQGVIDVPDYDSDEVIHTTKT